MRSQSVALRVTNGGIANYFGQRVVDKGYGFRIVPNLDPAIFNGDDNSRVLPGTFPVIVTVHKDGRDKRNILVRDSSWIHVPDGFDFLDLSAFGVQNASGQKNLYRIINGQPLAPMNYQVDIGERPGEKMLSPARMNLGVLVLNGNVTIPAKGAGAANRPRITEVSDTLDLYGVSDATGAFFYIFQQYKALKFCLASTTGASPVLVFQSQGDSGEFSIAEEIDASNWIVDPFDATKFRMVLNRDCYFANEWLCLISGDGTAITIDFATATFEY